MDPSVSAIIRKSLDGLSARYAATAQNIANVNSPGYRPVRVSFEHELRAVASRSPHVISAVPITTHAAADHPAGAAVRTDLELATASETSRRYGALIDILGRGLQLERTIVRGGQ